MYLLNKCGREEVGPVGDVLGEQALKFWVNASQGIEAQISITKGTVFYLVDVDDGLQRFISVTKSEMIRYHLGGLSF